ncbi:MAG: hypothetical protein BJ554DRAFT_2294, partial [Olpidium bornovanus]
RDGRGVAPWPRGHGQNSVEPARRSLRDTHPSFPGPLSPPPASYRRPPASPFDRTILAAVHGRRLSSSSFPSAAR